MRGVPFVSPIPMPPENALGEGGTLEKGIAEGGSTGGDCEEIFGGGLQECDGGQL